MRRTHRLLVASTLIVASTWALTAPVARATSQPATSLPATNLPAPATAPAPGTYLVKPGDNLAGIAKKLGVTLAQLLAVNGITAKSVIHPGDVLLVPGTSTSAITVASAAPPGASAAPATAPAAGQTTYVVQRGDALAGIAYKHGLKLGPVLKANVNLKIDSVVHPGMTLIIPAGGTLVVPPTPAVAPGQVNPAGGPAPDSVSSVDTVIAFATAQLGKEWKFNTAGPETFDCSGLTMAAYAEIKVALPHQSALQSTRGSAVDWRAEPIKAGDLVFMFTAAKPDVISHVGIAIDAKRWIHAPRGGDVVRIGSLPSADKIQAVRRFVTP